MLRQLLQAGVVTADAHHGGVGVPGREAGEGLLQGAEADVQGGEDTAAQSCEQRIHLAGVADAEFHHQPGPRGGGDGNCVVFQ